MTPVSHARQSPHLCLPLANDLVSFFTPDWAMDPPQDACTTFLLKQIPPQRSMGVCPHLLWGEVPSLFDPQEASLHACRQGRLPWPQEWASYLCFSRAQLLPLPCPWECLGENKSSVLLHVTNTRHPAQRPTVSHLITKQSVFQSQVYDFLFTQ